MYTSIMETIVKGALAGVAFGGLVAAVVDANINAVKALWRLNRLVAEMTFFTIEAVKEKVEKEMDRQLLAGQLLAEDEYDSTEDADDEAED